MTPTQGRVLTILGVCFGPAVWLLLKYGAGVSDRFLPSPMAVLTAFNDIEPSIWIHLSYTCVRLILGLLAGVLVGISFGIAMTRYKAIEVFTMPTVQSVRSVPAVAIVPFFLLWFGFSEIGRALLVVSGIAFNIAIATHQVLTEIPEKDRILFRGFKIVPGHMVTDYLIPRIQEGLLPTIRFSLSTAIGVVIVSELLGSQIGLGYLMQTARSTFSMHVVFLAAMLLGCLNAATDIAISFAWQRMNYWR